MASYNNFQSKNAKYSNKATRTDYEADFNSAVDPMGIKEQTGLKSNIDKYVDFISWCRWLIINNK